MPVIKITHASKIEGAPSQPFFSKMIKEYEKHPFLRSTDKGWRVDTDDPSWGEYLKGRRIKSGAESAPPPKENAPGGGAAKRAAAKSKPPAETKPAKTEKSGGDEKAQKSAKSEELRMNAVEARSWLTIQKAQKAEIDKKKAELELNVLEGNYIEKSRMVYYMGYFQRAITEGLDNIKRGCTDRDAVKMVCNKLKEHIAKTMDVLRKDEELIIPGGEDG